MHASTLPEIQRFGLQVHRSTPPPDDVGYAAQVLVFNVQQSPPILVSSYIRPFHTAGLLYTATPPLFDYSMQQSDSTTPTALLNPQSHRGPTIIAQSGQQAQGTNVLPSQSSSALPSATTTNASLNASGFSRTVEHPSYSLPDFRLSAHGATHTLQVAYGAALSAAPSHSPSARETLAGMPSVSTPSAHAASAPTRVLAPTTSTQATVGHLAASAARPTAYATTSTASSERWPCPLCPSDFGRLQELNRHLASVHRRGGSDGPLWACCGVPVEDARSKYGMSEEEIATSRRGRYNGRAMVGGCWSSNFSRRDAYARHLRDQHCIGDPYGEYHLGNQLG